MMDLGVGKSAMARVYFSHGLTSDIVMVKPAKSTTSMAKENFFGLSMMPCLPQMSSQATAWKKASCRVSAHSRVSSMHLVLSLKSDTISSYRLV